MKKIFFILFFIPFISYCQSDTEFKLQNSISVEWGKNCISQMDCFYLSLDSALTFSDDDIYDYYYILYYSYGKENRKTIATGDFSDLGYDITLNIFKNETNNSYVVIWKIEMEYVPSFYVCYIRDGIIMKIGEWGIAIPYIEYHCEYCDYAIEDIRIHQRDNEIEFSFLKNMNFVNLSTDIYNDDWVLYKAGNLKISFNIVDGLLKVIEKGK